MLHKRHKYDILVILAVIALADSVYLTAVKFLHLQIPCSLTHGCDQVLNSRYSAIFGVPLPVLGLVFFSSSIVLSLLANHYLWAKRLLTWVLALGCLSALSFLGIQMFTLKKICEYCVVTDTLAVLMFIWDLIIEHQAYSETPVQNT